MTSLCSKVIADEILKSVKHYRREKSTVRYVTLASLHLEVVEGSGCDIFI